MMSIRQLKEQKKTLGYTNEMIAEKSGVPLSTVQKIFCGATKHPRYDTLLALTKALSEYSYEMATYVVQEANPDAAVNSMDSAIRMLANFFMRYSLCVFD